MKGVYNLDAVFSAPGDFKWALGIVLTIFDICDASVFPKAPVLSKTTFDYLIGSGDSSVGIAWDLDSVSISQGV